MKAKKINARSKELENAMKELYNIKDGGVPPELAIQEAETLIETIEHQEAEINYLHDIMIKRGEQMVYEEMYNDIKKLADKQEREIVGLQVQRTGYQDIIQTQENRIKELEKYKKKHTLIKNNYISKDKIKAKIEELANEKEKYFEKQVIEHEINILQSLLEEE